MCGGRTDSKSTWAPIGRRQDIKVFWAGKPIYISHRTQESIDEAAAWPVLEPGPILSRPARVKGGATINGWFVNLQSCTHLVLLPIAHEGNYDGFFCPCH